MRGDSASPVLRGKGRADTSGCQLAVPGGPSGVQGGPEGSWAWKSGILQGAPAVMTLLSRIYRFRSWKPSGRQGASGEVPGEVLGLQIQDLTGPASCDDALITDFTFSLLEGPPADRMPPERSWGCKSGIWQAPPAVMTPLSPVSYTHLTLPTICSV